MPPKQKQIPPVRIIEDNPATEAIRFGFDAYAQTLSGLIANKQNVTPLVMGIYGSGGTGRTSLMRSIGARLDSGTLSNADGYRHCKTVWFNAWKHEGKDQLLAAVVECVFKAMDADGFFSLAKTQMDGLTKRIDKSKIFTSVSQLTAGADISEFFSDMAYKEKIGFYDTFQKFFNDLTWTFLNWRFKITEEEKLDDRKASLVIFIDDLDQCRRPHIVKMLETIKLFLNRTGWIFVFGASKEKLESALEEKYGREAGRNFLEKIVQVNFHLPPIPVEAFEPLIANSGEGADIIKKHLPRLIPALRHNPRRLKRFINDINLLYGLIQSAGVGIGFESVLLWVLVERAYPGLAMLIKDHPQNLFVLQKQIKKLCAGNEDKPLWDFGGQQLIDKKVPHALQPYIQIPHLVDAIKALEVTVGQLDGLLALYRAVNLGDPLSGSSGSDAISQRFLSLDSTAAVAAGPFLHGGKKETATIDTPFNIDIFPVTQGQFRHFIETGGYYNPVWWSRDGWRWRKDAMVEGPVYWDDARQHQDCKPVVGVSWYEAEAYSRWVSKALPTEQQWERAARGMDGWVYPWGNEFDKNRCNTQDSGLGSATAVDCYSDGVSPEGCYDMAGNIWEWTATPADEDREIYIVKGGSWADPSDAARCSATKPCVRPLRHLSIGFRCVQNIKT